MFRPNRPAKSRTPRAEQTRKLVFEALEKRELLAVSYLDAATGAALHHQDTISLTSYAAEASGQSQAPAYGETVFRRIALKNTGDDLIDITSVALSSGSKVELVGAFAQNLEPNEETSLVLKWQTLASQTSTLTIQTTDLDQPTFQLTLSGAVRANTTQYAQLGNLALQRDTGVSATDFITCNPTLTGAVSGDLYGGRLDVEFDFDADSDVDAVENVYVPSAFTFDPSEYSSDYAAPESGLSPVSLRSRDAIFAAFDDFDEDWDEIARVESYQQARIDSGLTVGSNVFENQTFDFEVCFVAGTPVLMADGTTKPIKEIRPGDMVLAADHLAPKGKPEAACVARFFDNGEKKVVCVRFKNGEELVCTPLHRFYVCEKGWVCAENLCSSDECLTADGKRVAFISRKEIEGTRRVYNFEVEKCHTYYVGEGKGLLTHNDCGDEQHSDRLQAVLDFYERIFTDAESRKLLDAYFANGKNTVEFSNLWFGKSRGRDGGITGTFWKPEILNHFRINLQKQHTNPI